MPSASLSRWESKRVAELDEIEDAHKVIGGSGRGRRYATQQINHAYAVLLSSQFQGFCRDLHDEAVDYLVAALQPVAMRTAVRELLTEGRKIDRGNANAGNLGADYGRLGLKLWERPW